MIISRTPLGRIIKSDGATQKTMDISKAVELYRRDLSIKQIGVIMNVGPSILTRRFKKLGISKDKGWRFRGKNFTIEHRNAISIGQKRLRNDPVEKERLCMGKNNPFYGHNHKPETIENMKVKLKGMMAGAKNPQWQGGKSLESYGYAFKRIIRHQVYQRDNYTCQKCGAQYNAGSGRLIAHHKDAKKDNCLLNNLITFCRPCHGKITMGARWNKEVAKIQ